MAKTRRHVRAGNHVINTDDDFITTIMPDLSVSSVISGNVVVAEVGTAIQGTTVTLTNGVYIRYGSTNSGYGYVGNDGSSDVASTSGYELAPGDQIIVQVANLNDLYFDASTTDSTFFWLAG